ncbi:cyclin B1, like [Denticeps clupeoides]|uniref:cyclin B1, like n=1 Tax=Denticeps clupeoides TaxID=299321 RepID=UPI0010A2C5DA|nr:G2/mitotic-specific cyclin-B1-like [Denticeps clupeoides]
MRSIVIDWLVQIHKQFKLQQETLYMAVGVLDRFLQVSPVTKKYLQLVAVTAMLISSKYEDIFPPTVEDCVYVTAYTYSCSDVCGMERVILKALNYSLGRPVPVHFLRRASKVGQVGPKEYGLAKYLMELTLLDYTLAHHPPSLIAAAAFALSLKVLKFGGWSPVLQHYTGYTESSLLPVMASIVQLLEGMHSGRTKHQFIKLKYESPRLLSVSCLSEISAFIKGR